MEKPCRDLFDKFEAEKDKMEQCWNLADSRQWRLTSIGLGGVKECTLCAGAIGKAVKTKKSSDIAAAILSCSVCGKSLAAFYSGALDYWEFLGSCNKQDLKAAAAARRWQKCAKKNNIPNADGLPNS